MRKLFFTTLALAASCALASDNVIELNSTTQFENLLKEKSIIIVDFYAPWCGPCRQQGPIIHSLATLFPDICFIKVNIDTFRDLSGKYSVASIPTILYFKNGKLDHRTVGLQRESTLKVALNSLSK